MDQIVKPPKKKKPKEQFLPALAEQIGIWFPDFGKRVMAVSEVSVTKTNVPTLPLAMVAFLKGVANPPMNADSFEIVDAFLVDFWLEPERYKRANGTETPFWSYYDYESIRDRLLTKLVEWATPNGMRISFRELTIEADEFAVTLTFRFTATFRWCPDDVDEGIPIEEVGFNLCRATPCCIPEEVDPCL